MMNSDKSSTELVNGLPHKYLANNRFIRSVQIVSWIVSAIFLAALVWSVFQAVVNGAPVPVWAWLTVIVLLAAAVGLAVVVVVYKGVTEQTGAFDLRPATRIAGELKSTSERVAAGGANSLRAEIKMTQGILQVAVGAADVLEADFTYDDADWKQPEVKYAVDAAAQGNLVLEQRATHRPAMRQGRAEWDIRLNQDLPTDLVVKFGAGKADLQLSGLNLSQLNVESGVGELAVDLSGDWQHSLQATVKAGIGDTVLRLPNHVGVRVQSTVSLGSIRPHELTWDGRAYTNALYGHSPVTLDIVVSGGVGKLNLEQSG